MKKIVKRTLNVPEDLWNQAKDRAAERDETISQAIRRFLERYTK